MKIKYLFTKFKTDIVDFQDLQLGIPKPIDYKQLNITQKSSIKEIYFQFMNHSKLYESQQLENKLKQVTDSYIKIIGQKIRNQNNLTLEELKELRFLQDNNFGFPFVEGLRRSELIVEYQQQIDAKWAIYQNPRATLSLMWVVFGLPSIWVYDQYQYK
ncbi:hypothetical protein pb186bvf_001060 [Paramecium bursaria]